MLKQNGFTFTFAFLTVSLSVAPAAREGLVQQLAAQSRRVGWTHSTALLKVTRPSGPQMEPPAVAERHPAGAPPAAQRLRAAKLK